MAMQLTIPPGLDDKIDRALEQIAAGKFYGPEESRRKLAALREAHLANRD